MPSSSSPPPRACPRPVRRPSPRPRRPAGSAPARDAPGSGETGNVRHRAIGNADTVVPSRRSAHRGWRRRLPWLRLGANSGRPGTGVRVLGGGADILALGGSADARGAEGGDGGGPVGIGGIGSVGYRSGGGACPMCSPGRRGGPGPDSLPRAGVPKEAWLKMETETKMEKVGDNEGAGEAGAVGVCRLLCLCVGLQLPPPLSKWEWDDVGDSGSGGNAIAISISSLYERDGVARLLRDVQHAVEDCGLQLLLLHGALRLRRAPPEQAQPRGKSLSKEFMPMPMRRRKRRRGSGLPVPGMVCGIYSRGGDV
ncbi:hypothetical protein B0H14DRAFT_1526200 [Mycena olivaceomarginata]|nr:hypothetical protein B0H14DRAFT_1526200 [Mycena olivaceomarginata]